MAMLSFLVVLAALTIEPMRLLITVPAGMIAAKQETPQARWTVIFLGGAIAAGVFAVISTQLMGATKFPWAESAVAGMLQAWLISLIFRKMARRSSAAGSS